MASNLRHWKATY